VTDSAQPPLAPRDAGTVHVLCTGCGRPIPFDASEAGTMFECARCETRFRISVRRPAFHEEYGRPPELSGRQMLGLLSLCFGAGGALFLLLPCLWMLCAPLAGVGVVLGVVGLGADRPRTLATAGTLLSLAAAAIGAALLVALQNDLHKALERLR
jgi:hypothetical protein